MLKGDHNDAQTISGGGHRVRSSTSRLPKHRVVPADVCDAQYPVLRPSYGPDIDVTVAVSPPRASRLSRRSLWSNGRSSLEVVHRVRSSTSRLPKHRVVPADVCDAQYPVLRPPYGPDIDVTVAVSPSVGVDRVDALEQRQRSILIGGSSTNRLPKHRVVPADVCDAQYPVLRPSYVPDIDCNRSPPGPGPVAKAEGPKSRLRCVSAIRTRLEGRRQIITYANTC